MRLQKGCIVKAKLGKARSAHQKGYTVNMSTYWKKTAKSNKRRLKLKALNDIKGKTVNEIANSIRVTGDSLLISNAWKSLKKKVHEKYGYQCMKCGRIPCNKKHSNVDHIKPRKYYPELALNFDNLQVLCGRCNKEKGNMHCTDYRHRIHEDVSIGEYSDFNIGRILKAL